MAWGDNQTARDILNSHDYVRGGPVGLLGTFTIERGIPKNSLESYLLIFSKYRRRKARTKAGYISGGWDFRSLSYASIQHKLVEHLHDKLEGHSNNTMSFRVELSLGRRMHLLHESSSIDISCMQESHPLYSYPWIFYRGFRRCFLS